MKNEEILNYWLEVKYNMMLCEAPDYIIKMADINIVFFENLKH